MIVKLKVICTVGSCPAIKKELNKYGWSVRENKPYYYDYIAEKETSESDAQTFIETLTKHNSDDIIDINLLPPKLIV